MRIRLAVTALFLAGALAVGTALPGTAAMTAAGAPAPTSPPSRTSSTVCPTTS